MASIFIKDYNTEVEFPDGMPQQEIEAALRSQFPPKVKDRSLLEKAASLVTMGHVGGEAGPEAEVSFTPEGKMTKQNVESGSDWANDPITALAMGAGGGLATGLAAKAGGATLGKALGTGLKYAGREATAWGTAGMSEVPGLAIMAGKGAVGLGKKILAKDMAPKVAKVSPAAPIRASREPLAAEVAPGQSMPTFPVKGETPAPGFVDQFMEAPVASPMDAVIAEVRGGAATEIPKFAESSAVNLERLNAPDDLKRFIDFKAGDIADKINKGVVTEKQLWEDAEKLGWNGNDAINTFRNQGAYTAAQGLATRQLNFSAAEELFKGIKNLPPGQTVLPQELRQQFVDSMALIKTTSQAATEAGRALRMHKINVGSNPEFLEASNLQKVMKSLGDMKPEKMDILVNKLKDVDMKDMEQVNRMIYDATTSRWKKGSDLAYELYLTGMLSQPISHIRNLTGNTLANAYTYPERFLGAAIEQGAAKIAGRTPERYMGETVQDVFSLGKGIQDGILRFKNVMKTGESFGGLDQKVSAIPNKYAKFMPLRALSASDAFFKGVAENSELNRLAYRQAKQAGLTGEALSDGITQILANPTVDMLEQAAKRGKYITYQQELGKIGQSFMNLREAVPGMKYITPFVKTPVNIQKFALERTPLEFGNVLQKAARGKLKGGELSEQLAKPLMGMMVSSAVWQMAEQGLLTGTRPKDKKEANELMATGWQPLSVKVGDKYYSYGSLEPIASIVGMTVDFQNVYKGASEDENYKLGNAIATAFNNNVTNKTFMQGFANLIESIHDPERFGPQLLNSLAGSVVPGVVGGIAKEVDPTIRDVRNPLDAMQARIPVASEGLPAKLTVWGEPIERPGTALTRMFSPVALSAEKGSPIEKSLAEMKGGTIGYPPRKVANIELEPEEYWQYVAEARQPAKKMLDMFAQSANWKNMPDELKDRQVKSIVDKFQDIAHKKMVMKLYQDGRLVPKTDKEMMYLYNTLK